MKEEPLISIIVANYNNTEYIKPFIDSIVSQTYENWELLIVDDCSTNNSCEIIKDYIEIDKRIKLFVRNRVPKGACTCRNIGLEKASGKYLCFFDSDDIVPNYSLKVRVEEMEKVSSSVSFIVFPAISFINKPLDSEKLVIGIPLFKDDLEQFIKRYRLPFAVWTNIYRTSDFKKYNIIWDEKLMSLQDSDLNISSITKGMKYHYSTDIRPHYFWRIGGNEKSITKTIQSVSNFHSQLYFFQKLLFIDKYQKYAYRFGKTLLLRSLLCKYDKIPKLLVDNKYTLCRVTIVRSIVRNFKIQNKLIIILIFASFFPFCYLNEFVFRFNNRLDIIKYFNKIRSYSILN